MTPIFKNQVSFVDDNNHHNVMEAENKSNISGTLNMIDLNTGKSVAFIARHSVRAKYGTFTLDKNGNWTYTSNQDIPAIKCLRKDGMYTDSFTAVSVDGREKVVMVTIIGVADETAINVNDANNNPPPVRVEYGVITLAADNTLMLTTTLSASKKEASTTGKKITANIQSPDFYTLIQTTSSQDSIRYSKPHTKSNLVQSII